MISTFVGQNVGQTGEYGIGIAAGGFCPTTTQNEAQNNTVVPS
jgi:hypothetical protein